MLNPEGVLHILDNLNLVVCGIVIAHKTRCTMKNSEEMHQQSCGQVFLNVGSNEYLTKKKTEFQQALIQTKIIMDFLPAVCSLWEIPVIYPSLFYNP